MLNFSNQAFMSALTLTILTAVALTIMGTVFSQQIVDLSGARDLGDEMRRMSADYLFYYSAFSLPMLMSNCLSVFVRNYSPPPYPLWVCMQGQYPISFLTGFSFFRSRWAWLGLLLPPGWNRLSHFWFCCPISSVNMEISGFGILRYSLCWSEKSASAALLKQSHSLLPRSQLCVITLSLPIL